MTRVGQRGAQDLVGRVIGGRFEIEALIGRGRQSMVMAARDLEGEPLPDGTAPLVALKLLPNSLAEDAAFVRRFRHDVRAAAGVDHPNVVRVIAWGDEGQLFVVNEFIGGGSLRAVMNTGVTIQPVQAGQIALDVARGLDHLHRRGIVHRAIRPSNIMLRDDGRAVVADVGVSHLLEDAAGDANLDFRFMAPELARGKGIDGKFDVYALGLSLVEAVTGEIPLLGADMGSTLNIRAEHTVPVGSDWGRMRRPLARAVHPSPARRSSADEFEIALMALSDQTGETPRVRPVGAFDIDGSEPPVDSVQPTFRKPPPGIRRRGATDAPPADTRTALTSTTPAATSGDAAEDDAPPPVVRRQFRTQDTAPAPEAATAATAPTPTESADTPPASRLRRWPTIAALAFLAIAIGLVLRLVVFAPPPKVPELVGEDIQVARLAAKQNGWKLNETELVRKDGTAKDEIVDQVPQPGVRLKNGATLRVAVSLGATLVPFPNVATQPLATAKAALKSAGFVTGDVRSQLDEKVAKGSVVLVDADIDSQGRLAKGSTVNLVVSAGPAPRKIPGGLRGKDVEDVIGALDSLQLGHKVARKSDPKVPLNAVLSAVPAEGTDVPRDSVVTLIVSSGPPPVAVPFMGGQPALNAQGLLEKVGLKLGPVTGPITGSIAGTEPQAGTLVPPGTAIRVVAQ